jgi:two-component sensor histidine kinase
MPDFPPTEAIQIPGGGGAPGRARSHVLAQLQGRASPAAAQDAALIVSELVTNSVLHADVGQEQALTLELATLTDRIRLSVTDAGSSLKPRMLPTNRSTPGGFGLRLVNDMSCAWGVERDGSGRTRVWCELPLRPVSLP